MRPIALGCALAVLTACGQAALLPVQAAPAAAPVQAPGCEGEIERAMARRRPAESGGGAGVRQQRALMQALVGAQMRAVWDAEAMLQKLAAVEQELGKLETSARSLAAEVGKLKPSVQSDRIIELGARSLAASQQAARLREQALGALYRGEQAVVDALGPPERLAADIPGTQARCDGGDAQACVRLGQLYEHGVGLAQDATWAVNLFGSACQAGVGYGCWRQALLLLDGPASVQQLDKGVAAAQRACELGTARGCERLAQAYEAGRGVSRDQVVAAELFQRACLGDASSACVTLGLKRQEGRGVVRSFDQAENLFRLACDAGDVFGCSYLGEMYLNGNGVRVDVARGSALLVQGCEGGNAWACAVLRGGEVRASP